MTPVRIWNEQEGSKRRSPKFPGIIRTIGWVLLYCILIVAAMAVIAFVVFLITPTSRAYASPSAPREEGAAIQAPIANGDDLPYGEDMGNPSGQPRTSFSAELGEDRAIMPSDVSASHAAYVTISRLARADTAFDSTLVSFRGEVVGEPVRSATTGRRWITMQTTTGGTASIGVLMDDDQIALIENYGAYQTKGTVLLVTGVYRVADANETGSLDVTAYDVRVIEKGGYRPQNPTEAKLYTGIALCSLGVLLIALNAFLRRRNRA